MQSWADLLMLAKTRVSTTVDSIWSGSFTTAFGRLLRLQFTGTNSESLNARLILAWNVLVGFCTVLQIMELNRLQDDAAAAERSVNQTRPDSALAFHCQASSASWPKWKYENDEIWIRFLRTSVLVSVAKPGRQYLLSQQQQLEKVRKKISDIEAAKPSTCCFCICFVSPGIKNKTPCLLELTCSACFGGFCPLAWRHRACAVAAAHGFLDSGAMFVASFALLQETFWQAETQK